MSNSFVNNCLNVLWKMSECKSAPVGFIVVFFVIHPYQSERSQDIKDCFSAECSSGFILLNLRFQYSAV